MGAKITQPTAKIVIIADDAVKATMLAFYFEGKGYECIVVDSLEKSLALNVNHVMGAFYASEFEFHFMGKNVEAQMGVRGDYTPTF